MDERNGSFTNESAPKFEERYILMCYEGAINLDINQMGLYPFCTDCCELKQCREFSRINRVQV